MHLKVATVLLIISYVTLCEALSESQNEVEGRGKKKKIALFVFIADIIVKKFFILKLIYAFVFWLVIHKAGYFLTWFVSYLKEEKRNQYVPHHDHHYDHHYEYSSPYHGPYRRQNIQSQP